LVSKVCVEIWKTELWMRTTPKITVDNEEYNTLNHFLSNFVGLILSRKKQNVKNDIRKRVSTTECGSIVLDSNC
jgi:hypothetical protein